MVDVRFPIWHSRFEEWYLGSILWNQNAINDLRTGFVFSTPTGFSMQAREFMVTIILGRVKVIRIVLSHKILKNSLKHQSLQFWADLETEEFCL